MPPTRKRPHITITPEAEPASRASPRCAKLPPNFKRVWQLVEDMRSSADAPVDTMGCERLADETQSPATRRYQQLVSLMLSSQTKDELTAQVMQRLQAHGLTVANILRTSRARLTALLLGVGFHNRKAEYLAETTRILHSEYGGDSPGDLARLLRLPGVGPKMAHLFLQVAYGQCQGIGVDVHMHRISGRLGWVKAAECPTPEHTRRALEEWLPRQYWRPINALLVGFGQTVCRPVYPRCADCTARALCPAAFAPPPPPKRAKTSPG